MPRLPSGEYVLSEFERHVIEFVRRYEREFGACMATTREMAEELNRSLSHTANTISELARNEFLRRQIRQGPQYPNGRERRLWVGPRGAGS